MNSILRITAPATKLAVTVSDARQHLRVADLDQDNLIATYIQAAQQSIGLSIGRSLVPVSYALDIYRWCNRIVLPMPPVQSVTAVKTLGSDNLLAAIDTSLYDVSITSEGRGVVHVSGGYIWNPGAYGQVLSSIEFTAGYLVTPAPLRAAVLLTVGTLFENRSEASAVPTARVAGVERLIAPYMDSPV